VHITIRVFDVSEGIEVMDFFKRKGVISVNNLVEGKTLDEEAATDLAIEVMAEEVNVENGELEFICDPSDFKDCNSMIEERGIKALSSEIEYLPLEKVELDENLQVFYRTFFQLIRGNVDVNFQYVSHTANFDLEI